MDILELNNVAKEMLLTDQFEQIQTVIIEQPYQPAFLQERLQFKTLLLTNPNYFGHLKEITLPPVVKIVHNTTYEQLVGAGYQPQTGLLEAVVAVRQSSGYGGQICSLGTPEYVRFFASHDDGATWENVGMVSFQAHDISGAMPLNYDVKLPYEFPKHWCSSENVLKIRAILSWNRPIDPNPDFSPIWGDVKDVHIEVDPLKIIFWKDVIAQTKFQLPAAFQEAVKAAPPLEASTTQAVSVFELHEMYGGGKIVPPHRFMYPEVHKLVSNPQLSEVSALSSTSILGQLGLKLGDLLGQVSAIEGNTHYEELRTVGLNTALDTLAAVVTVKLPNGYSGNLCSAGSREYVAFWIDYGTGWTYAGTSSVTVHDIVHTPTDGLQYAVEMPVDFSTHRRLCVSGAAVVKVRGVLSWSVLPSHTDPNAPPVWGNHKDVMVQIKPGEGSLPGTHVPFIETVGGMDIVQINSTSGLANGLAVTAGFTAQDSPFGGEVIITGHIANTPDISQGATPLYYRISVSQDGIFWQPLTNAFTIYRDELLDGVWSTLPAHTQSAPDGWYTYQEDLVIAPGDPQIFVAANVLARWQTAGFADGIWKLQIEVRTDKTNPLHAWFGPMVTMRLNNTAPSVTLTMDKGECGDFKPGDLLTGTYSVSSQYFNGLSLYLEPANGGNLVISDTTTFPPFPATPVMPLSRSYAGSGVPTTGESKHWEMNTAKVKPCGYVMIFGATDRTIVSSGYIGFSSATLYEGFCLLK